MAQHCHQMTFSPSSDPVSALKHLQQPHHSHHLSFQGHIMAGGGESGYASGFSLSRPVESFDVTVASSRDTSRANGAACGEVQTTPRTTAAINYMSALQLSTPRIGIRTGRKGTPLKRQQSIFNHSAVFETTPKKCKSHENNENESSWLSRSCGSDKVPFRARLDRSFSHTMSPHNSSAGVGSDKLDCTFDAISSSTPISQPFRAEFYEQQIVEEFPQKNFLIRSGGKNTRLKLIRKTQSFSPRKLMGLRATKLPLREMDQNSADFHATGLFPVMEEESPIPKTNTGAVKKALFSDTTPAVNGAFSSGLSDLIFGTIKSTGSEKTEEQRANTATTNLFEGNAITRPKEEESNCDHKEPQSEPFSQLLDIYVSNLSHLDNGDSNSRPVSTEDADVSMNSSMVNDVERYFDELKRNTTQIQDDLPSSNFVSVTKKDSLTLYDMLGNDKLLLGESTVTDPDADEKGDMEVEQQTVENVQAPMLLRKRKRPSTELIQAVLATPKKMRRSQSFHIGDLQRTSSCVTDENVEWTEHSVNSNALCSGLMVSPSQRLGGARKRLNYDPVNRNRFSPAKRSLGFDGVGSRRRSLNGTQKLNIFKHLANCPPVRDYFLEFVGDKDLAAIYAVSRQCRSMIEEHPKLNARRLKYLEAAWRKKENNIELSYNSTTTSTVDETVLRVQGERSVHRIPLHNRNVDTSSSVCSSINETMSPPVSPSKRKFYENQKVRIFGLGLIKKSLIINLFISALQLVQRNPGAFMVSCPRCRSSSLIERPEALVQLSQSTTSEQDNSFSGRALRSQSMCASDFPSRHNDSSLMIPVRKQFSLPESSSLRLPKENAPEQRMAVCQSSQCGFRFCVHCSYAFEPGHTCIEIGTLSPLIKQARQPRVVACSKQSKRNLKRL